MNTRRRDLLKYSPLALSAFASAAANAQPANLHASESPLFFDVKRYGATGTGKHLDSPGVNAAIDAAVAAGGGTVVFPAGTYLCFSIRLKTNVHLYLCQGATILVFTCNN